MFDTRLRCCEFMYHKTAISKNTKTVLNMTKLILNKNKTNIQISNNNNNKPEYGKNKEMLKPPIFSISDFMTI